MKKYLIHDLPNEEFNKIFGELPDIIIIDANKTYARCKGCFGCWLKTPGECVLTDGMEHLGTFILTADEITIISKNLYGGFSVPIKKLWDRCIPGVMPFFAKRNNELHHTARYKNRPTLRVYFYNADEMTYDEKALSQKLIVANAINFMCDNYETHFLKCANEVEL